MRKEVGKELADIRGKTSELVEKKVAAAYFVNLAWMSQRNLMALSPLENLDQSQKSECASRNASHRWHILRPTTQASSCIGAQKSWRGQLGQGRLRDSVMGPVGTLYATRRHRKHNRGFGQ
jgi:hypothetical protein